MKLSWKLFFVTTPVLILVLTVFGMWMLQASFSDSLEREVEQCSLENKYAATSYILSKRAYEDISPGRYTEEEVVTGFHEPTEERAGCLRIYDAGKQVLYEDNGLYVGHGIEANLDKNRNFGYEICQVENGEYYVAAVSRTEEGYTVETLRRVTDVFTNRREMSVMYRYGLLAASLCVGFIMWLTLYLSLRKTGELSRTARALAEGDLSMRARDMGQDEIGSLAWDFNRMADTMAGQMEQLKDEAERKDAFTSAFAHELKTPLTSIIGYSEMLATMDLSEAEIRICGDTINRQSRRLQSLSYKLLNMAFLGRQELELKPIRCRELAAQVELVEKPLVEKRGMVWRMEVADGRILGDSELLQSLLFNLIDNGVKASRPGGLILLYGCRDGEDYAFLVLDQGNGVPKEELPRLTEAFYMVDKSRSRKEGGAGLGLTLCSQIARLHGARMEFDSEEGKGMRICVRFPQMKTSRYGRTEKDTSPLSNKRADGRKKEGS